MNIQQPCRVAMARVSGGNANPQLTGTVEFREVRGGVEVTARVMGLPQNNSGFFALHVHEGGSCGGAAFAETGTHFNPTMAPHPRHAGDLPPLLSAGGRAYLSVLTDRFSVSDVVGRTIVIHAGPDDFRTQPAGNSGAKIACGVIMCRPTEIRA